VPPESLKKLGLHRWEDVVLHFPLRYENESEVRSIASVQPGQFVQVQVTVVSSRIVFRPRRMLLVEVEDESGSAVLRFIYFKDAQRMAYAPGLKCRILGEARKSLAGLEFIHPRMRTGWLAAEAIGAQPMVPVYPTAAGISQLTLRRAVQTALTRALPHEWLPPSVLTNYGLMPLQEAIRLIHAPPADAEHGGLLATLMAREGAAWDRIRFDELLAQQLLLRRARQLRRHERAASLANGQLAQRLIRGLPFALTSAQQRVWREISEDLQRDVPMHRLLQGDVGSGKTAIAALAAAQGGQWCPGGGNGPDRNPCRAVISEILRVLGGAQDSARVVKGGARTGGADRTAACNCPGGNHGGGRYPCLDSEGCRL